MEISAGLKKVIRGLILGLAAAAFVSIIWLSGLLDGFEGKTWDMRARALVDPKKASKEITVILLDQASLDWGKEVNQWSWPWPREVVAVIAQFCTRAGAKALAYDVIYSEPSVWGVEDDKAFRDSLAQFGNSIGAIVLNNTGQGESSWPSGYPEMNLLTDEANEKNKKDFRDFVYSHALFPVNDLSGGFRAFANVEQVVDPDGIYREVRLFSFFNGKFIPGLPLAAFLSARKEKSKITFDKNRLAVDDNVYALNQKGRVVINFRGPGKTYTTFSAMDIIRSELQLSQGETPDILPDKLKDKYVLFGYSAPGLLDIRPSPVDASAGGVEIHAAVLDNLLNNDFIYEAPPFACIICVLFLAMLAGVLASLFTDALRSSIIFFLITAFPVAAGFGGYVIGLKLPTIGPEIAFIVTLAGASIFNFATEGKQKRFIKGAFRQYLSPAVIEQLINHPEKLKLGGERRELSVYFSDLQGFTSISEMLTPESLTALLNEYLSAMTDIILEEGGTVDKYEGDAIIAFWNAPLSQEDHALRALRSALRCQAKLAEMRPGLKQRLGRDLLMRVGLNTGFAVVGNMGSSNRFDYTMLGDAVNLASRLEGINKQFNTYTMISQAMRDRIGDAYAVREISRVAVVGRKEPVVVYEPMEHSEYAGKTEVFAVFAKALQAFYAGDVKQARQIFDTIRDKDPVAVAYIQKCDELLANPSQSFSGVWVMTVK